VRWLAEGCERAGPDWCRSALTTFDGLLDRPYVESDQPSPQSVYGSSKLVGETEALVLGTAATIVRTSWVCSRHGSNMVKTIMRLAAERPELAFVDDQVGHPTFTSDLAPMIRRLAIDRRSGVHHVTNQTSTSWYGFAREVVAAMGKDPEMVRPITTAELQPPRPARRPANSVLDNAVLRAAGLPLLRDFTEPLRETVAALQ
jgi:dTDP-4-dehydrorhamnose reductase